MTCPSCGHRLGPENKVFGKFGCQYCGHIWEPHDTHPILQELRHAAQEVELIQQLREVGINAYRVAAR